MDNYPNCFNCINCSNEGIDFWCNFYSQYVEDWDDAYYCEYFKDRRQDT